MQFNGQKVNSIVFNGNTVNRAVFNGNEIFSQVQRSVLDDTDFVMVLSEGVFGSARVNFDNILGGGDLGDIVNGILSEEFHTLAEAGFSFFGFPWKISVPKNHALHMFLRSLIDPNCLNSMVFGKGEIDIREFSDMSDGEIEAFFSETLRGITVNGCPDARIFTLDPLEIEHRDVNVNDDMLGIYLQGSMDNIVAWGLSDFRITEFSIDRNRGKARYATNIDKLQICGEHYAFEGYIGAGEALPIFGEGAFDAQINNIYYGAISFVPISIVEKFRQFFPEGMSDEDIAVGILSLLRRGGLPL